MKKTTLSIATRKSPLALWQANWVKQQLIQFFPTLEISLLEMTTTADRWLEEPLTLIGGKGLFVKELEEALREGRADIAVHSMKDVPMQLPAGLNIPVMCARADARDVLVAQHHTDLASLPQIAVVGTSSLRRQSQLLALRPDLQCKTLRGNVNTRLKKLMAGEFDAIILAAAGLKRLALTTHIQTFFPVEQILPAAGQGVLGIECRENDARVRALLQPLQHEETFQCVTAERALCRRLGGGCQSPVAAYAEILHDKLYLRGAVAKKDGTVVLRAEHQDAISQAEKIGEWVADKLLQQGAAEFLHASL